MTIFLQAKSAGAIIMTKGADFIKLLERFGPPPQIIWVTAGNTSNAHMREVLTKNLDTMIDMIGKGEPLIEIRGI